MKLEKNTAYRCKTKNIAISFLKQAKKENLRWASTEGELNIIADITYWDLFNDLTCYYIDDKNEIWVSSFITCLQLNDKIIVYSESNDSTNEEITENEKNDEAYRDKRLNTIIQIRANNKIVKINYRDESAIAEYTDSDEFGLLNGIKTALDYIFIKPPYEFSTGDKTKLSRNCEYYGELGPEIIIVERLSKCKYLCKDEYYRHATIPYYYLQKK